jgi:Kelch motif/Galactose oxidase, central domain
MTVRVCLPVVAGAILAIVACGNGEGQPTTSSRATVRVVSAGRMTVARAAHQATLLPDGRVLITGGCSGSHCDTALSSTETYDPTSGEFRPAAPMALPRASHAAVALSDGRILVVGGWTGRRATATAEIYDPANGAWTAADSMTSPRVSCIARVLRDGRVLIVGGGNGGLPDLATAEVFEPRSHSFAPVGPMASNHYLATLLSDGRVLVTGGQGPDGAILASAEVFDPATSTFRRVGDMGTPRVKHGAALLGDGRVLIIGGSDGRGFAGRFSSTEIYDPATESFSPGPRLHDGRHKLRDAVVTLSSGEVLVAGGARRPEVFDPASGGFTQVDGMLAGPQMFATATALRSGNVLVLGGYDEHTRPSAAAWLIIAAAPDSEPARAGRALRK